MTLIYPELERANALMLASELRGLNHLEAADRIELDHPEATFPPVGGTKADRVQLEDVRATIVGLAGSHGYPAPRGPRTAGFDRDCAVALHEILRVTPHTASSEGLWAFLTECVLPDIALWRFPDPAVNRLVGHVNRNTFRRLWWRIEILGQPPAGPDPIWDLEDVLVQIMERPGLSGNPSVARALAQVFRAGVADRPQSQCQELMRDFQLRVMRSSAVIRLDLLTNDELLAVLNGHIDETRSHLS